MQAQNILSFSWGEMVYMQSFLEGPMVKNALSCCV